MIPTASTTAQKLSFGFAVLMALLWLATRPHAEAPLWLSLVHAIIFLLPIACQLARNNVVKIYGVWLGVFLILHGYISMQIKPKLLTQVHNMDQYVTVKKGLPGVEGVQHVTTDSMGFRTTKPIDYLHKAPGTYRIFALGASTTEQIYLDDHKTWTHLLQEGLSQAVDKNVEVINTGVSGMRAEQIVATLKTIQKYSPDMAIFLLGINDWNRQIHDAMGAPPKPIKKRFHNIIKLHDKLAFEKSLLGRILQGIFADQNHTTYYTFDGKYDELRGGLLSKPQKTFMPDQVSANYIENLTNIAQECQNARITCVFLTQPNGYDPHTSRDYQQSFWMTPPYTDYTLDMASLHHIANLYNNYLIDFSKDKSMPLCDLAKDIPPSGEYMSDECHFNINGAKTVATSLQRCIAPLLAR